MEVVPFSPRLFVQIFGQIPFSLANTEICIVLVRPISCYLALLMENVTTSSLFDLFSEVRRWQRVHFNNTQRYEPELSKNVFNLPQKADKQLQIKTEMLLGGSFWFYSSGFKDAKSCYVAKIEHRSSAGLCCWWWELKCCCHPLPGTDGVLILNALMIANLLTCCVLCLQSQFQLIIIAWCLQCKRFEVICIAPVHFKYLYFLGAHHQTHTGQKAHYKLALVFSVKGSAFSIHCGVTWLCSIYGYWI